MVTLTVAVAPRPTVDAVSITVSGVPEGRTGTVTGSADGRTWEVAKDLAPGTTVLADVQAPLGAPILYTLAVSSGEVAAAGPVTRTARGRFDLITDLTGQTAVTILRPHADPLTYDPGATFLPVPGADRHPGLFDPSTPEPTGDFTFRVESRAALDTLHRLVLANRPVVVLHRPCPLPECDVAPARLVYLESVKSDLAERRSLAERTFTVGWRPVPLSSRLRAPVVTVGEVASPRNFRTVREVRDRVPTVRALVEGAWIAH